MYNFDVIEIKKGNRHTAKQKGKKRNDDDEEKTRYDQCENV